MNKFVSLFPVPDLSCRCNGIATSPGIAIMQAVVGLSATYALLGSFLG